MKFIFGLHTYFDKLNMTTRAGQSELVEDCGQKFIETEGLPD